MRQEPNTDMMKQYVDVINDRFLKEQNHYDPETKKYNVGSFYIHQGMGRRGVDYEIRQVETEEGGYRTVGPQNATSEQCLFWLDGFVRAHYETCELLGYELELPSTEENAEGEAEENEDAGESMGSFDELFLGKAEGSEETQEASPDEEAPIDEERAEG